MQKGLQDDFRQAPFVPNNILVAGARYVPNTQLLSIPFRSQLIHEAA